MGGVGCDPEYLFTWPNALTGARGEEQTALIMAQVVRVAAERRGEPLDEAALQAQKERLIAHFDGRCDAFYTSGHLPDQDVFYPCDTRKVLGLALETI